MKLLLLGANGQVGFELQRALAPLGELVAATRRGRLPGGAACAVADLADPDALEALLGRERPDVVVNAAAYTAVDRAEGEEAAAHAANAVAPAALARWCHERDALLVHYSTDYVFDGRGTRPYRENDPVAPLGVYGRSKLAGEEAVRRSGARHLILRTAWVYAARGQNFLRTMLRLASERDELRVVEDQRGAPTPARWIAAATALALARQSNGAGEPRLGTFHLSAAGETSWFEFAQAIFEAALAAGLLERAPRLVPIASSEYPTPARRPAYSRLDNRRFNDGFALRLPEWRRGVADVVAELAAR
jgi:dTDP-4-dehydrorhamnose reductase